MDKIELEDFIGFLEELSLKEIRVPPVIKIPNWPKAAGEVTVEVTCNELSYPARAVDTGLMRLLKIVKKKQLVTFTIEESGTFRVAFLDQHLSQFSARSNGAEDFERIRALMLFDQFKDEVFLKVIEKLKADLIAHKRMAANVQKAVETLNTSYLRPK